MFKTAKSEKGFNSNDKFNSFGDVKWCIANGWTLPSGDVPLERVCTNKTKMSSLFID